MMDITFQPSIVALGLSILWVLPWKLYGVWLAARRGEKKWFVALLILNTLAILEIIYIFYIVKKPWSEIVGTVKRIIKYPFR